MLSVKTVYRKSRSFAEHEDHSIAATYWPPSGVGRFPAPPASPVATQRSRENEEERPRNLV